MSDWKSFPRLWRRSAKASGRLAAALLHAGYDVVAVEPLDAILAGHISAERALAGRV
jgi:hypothetical protein